VNFFGDPRLPLAHQGRGRDLDVVGGHDQDGNHEAPQQERAEQRDQGVELQDLADLNHPA